MTVYTESHLEVNWNQPVISLHVSMARYAIDPAPYVRLMVEFDMVRNIINPDPGDRGLCVIVPSFLHDLRVLGNDIGMTKKAQTHRRDAWIP